MVKPCAAISGSAGSRLAVRFAPESLRNRRPFTALYRHDPMRREKRLPANRRMSMRMRHVARMRAAQEARIQEPAESLRRRLAGGG